MKKSNYKILELHAENIKRLKVVDITFPPGENVVVIGGKNNAGKSTALDTVMYGLGGKNLICDEPIRRGKKKGEITLKLGNPEADPPPVELTVKRTFKKNSPGALVITQSDKKKIPLPPQAMLDGMKNNKMFDPIKFMNENPRKQADILRQLVGIDTTDVDAKISAAREERTIIGRIVKEKKGARDDAENGLMGERPERVDVSAVVEELEKAKAHNASCQAGQEEMKQIEGNIEDTAQEIRRLKEMLDAYKKKESDLVKWLTETQPIDTAPLTEKIGNAETVNTQHAQHVRFDELDESYTDAEVEYSTLTEQIETLDEEKTAMLAAAKFPIEGLAIEDDIVMFNGIPLDQAGSAEQTRVSAAIGLAQHPNLNIMLIRHGSLMDDESMIEMRKIAKKYDAQVMIEVVGEEGGSIIIEEGEVKPCLVCIECKESTGHYEWNALYIDENGPLCPKCYKAIEGRKKK